MHRFTNVLGALSLVAVLGACGGGYSGFVIPHETELKPWVAPPADELVDDEDADADDADDADYEDYEDGEDEDAAPAAKPAASPAPKPAVPAK